MNINIINKKGAVNTHPPFVSYCALGRRYWRTPNPKALQN